MTKMPETTANQTQDRPVTLVLTEAAFGYRNKAVVRGITANFRTGGITAILGNNGIGKSTLMKGILALTPCLQGSVLLHGQPVNRLPAGERARQMAYLEQQATCHWPMSVARVVALGRYPHGGAASHDPVMTAMNITDTARFADRPVTQLSGGERSRVMLARALATDAPVLLADEPVAGLDPRHQLSVMERLQHWASTGRTVIVILHDLNLALRYCDDVLLLTDHSALFGPSAQILTPATIRQVFGVAAQTITVDGRTTLVNWSLSEPSQENN
jgi:iron complex transport system ATP-binding protein